MQNVLIRRVLATALALSSAIAMAGPINVSLSSGQNSLKATENVNVTVTFSNQSGRPVRVLKWYTPIEDVEEALFEVKRDGVEVPYLGAHYKRPAPSAADYVTLKAGQSITREVELSSVYDFSVTGTYSVRYKVGSNLLFANRFERNGKALAESKMGDMNSASVYLNVSGRPFAKVTDEQPQYLTTGGVTFSGRCDNTQQNTITTALNNAQTYATESSSYLQASNGSGARFQKWFGNGSVTTARSHFTSIKDAFDSKPITVDCSCKKTYYAYVYPTQPYKIYVCRAFWSAPATGTDSKAGTMIHEMSHFNAVAGTDDWAYGQSAAASLAISNPTKALDNADNHEYFAENTPNLN